MLIAKIQDAVDNQIIVTACSDKPLYVHEILDGAERKTTFEYTLQEDGSLKCTAIRAPWQTDGNCTRFIYEGGCLTKITHEDDRKSKYSYYTTKKNYHLLIQAKGDDGLGVRYEYSNTGATYGLPYCTTYAETGEKAILPGEESNGNAPLYATKVTYEYGNHLTLVTDNISGKALRYHFNDNGNQTSINDGLGYAIYTEYDQSGDNANAPINHATTRSRMQRVVKNLLRDSMIEEGSSVWETSRVGTFTRDQTTDQWGLVSYKVNVPTGYTTYVRQAVTLQPGGQYTLSAYMKSAAPKAFVRAAYTYHGETRYFSSDAVPVDANASTGEFKRVSVSFTLPDEADAIVYCEAVGMTNNGHFWFDCMQLEEGLTCNHYNMLQNSDFTYTKAGSTLPAAWEIDTASRNFISVRDLSEADDIDGKMAPQFLQGSRAVRLAGRYDRTVTLTQDFRCYGNGGDRFTAGGWCKSFAKKVDTSTSVYCCLNVYFSGGSYWQYGGSVTFNYGEDDWQFASSSIVAPDNYTRIRFALYMNRQMNHADFTGLYLYPEAFGTDYVYDAKGNRKEAIQLYGGVKKTEFDDHDNMIRYTAPGHTKSSTFSYGDTEDEQKKHLLLESSSPLGTKGSYGYDANGNAVRSDTFCGSGTSGLITRSTTEYQHNGNYVHKQTDARGKTVTTVVDEDKGITTCVTDPKGQSVNCEYDSLRRVVKVKTMDGSREFRNEYTYDQTRGLLTGVKHNTDANPNNDVSYTFEYDALGRKTKVKVGNATLSTNVYQNDPEQAHYGTLSLMQYGNGAVVKNEYDDFNRVTGVKYDSEENPRYQYAYNANGQVAYVRNNLINQSAESEYDLSNRPCRIKTHKFIADAAGNVTSQEHVYTGEVEYEKFFGRLSKFTEQVGDNHEEFVTSIGYDDENRPTSLAYAGYGQSTLEYDALGRVVKATVKAGSDTVNETTYSYVAGAELETTVPSDSENEERKAAAANATSKTSTTGLVASITQTGGNFTYTYDDNGNITSVVQDGVTTSYTYDALGQLIRVVDGQEGATWEYTYDQGGNILSKKKFVGADETESMVFGYVHEGSELDETQIAENGWRDLLKYVNGKRITYDKIGNPLNDGTWQYEWVNGRQLARMHNVDTDASFIYNENGLRVQKTVNGVVTDYTLHGKNVVHMTQGSNELHFFYDAQNKPAVVVYNGTPYSYVKNLQGDIVAILNSACTVVVSYVYDAWGRLLNRTGSMKDDLGKLNPFRYRGYVYDEETGLYYLDTRYYEPSKQRILSADKLLSCVGIDIHSHNTYCYCINRPICYLDNEGCWPDWGAVLKVAAVVTAVVAAVAITVTTCGAGSVAGTMVISSALGIAARGAEVAVLQGKQSYQDGDSFEEGVTDVVNAWVNNGSKIVKPQAQVLKGVTYGFGIYSQSPSFAPVLELMTYDGLTLGRKMPFCMIPKPTPTAAGNVLGSMLSDVGDRYANAGYHLRTEASTLGKVIGYAGAAWDGANLCMSIFSSDPSERAKQRGYQVE